MDDGRFRTFVVVVVAVVVIVVASTSISVDLGRRVVTRRRRPRGRRATGWDEEGHIRES